MKSGRWNNNHRDTIEPVITEIKQETIMDVIREKF